MKTNQSKSGFSYLHLICFVLLWVQIGLAHAATFLGVTTLKQDADPARAINIVFVSQASDAGYLSLYRTEVDTSGRYFINISPYAEYSSYFNIYRVDILTAPGENPITPEVLQALPGTNNIYVHMIYYVSSQCGGGGVVDGCAVFGGKSVYILSTGNVRTILMHELGHTVLGSLGDEYGATTVAACVVPTSEPSYPNLTINTNSSTVKWGHWFGQGTGIGLVQGGGYCDAGIYRPAADCIMRHSGSFCSVCKEELVLGMNRQIVPARSVTPAPGSIATLPRQVTRFTADIDPAFVAQGTYLQVRWSVYANNQLIQSGAGSTLDADLRAVTLNTAIKVEAQVIDPDVLNFVLKAADVVGTTYTWNLTVSDAGITKIGPSAGAPGSLITITGTNLGAATGVAFNGLPATLWQVVGDARISVFVPYGATTGRVTVITPQGTAVSAGNFTVIVPPPSITGLSRNSGPVGTLLTIKGAYFTDATEVAFTDVDNGPVPAALWQVIGDTKISVFVPIGARTGQVAVTTPQGTAYSPGVFTVVGAGPPTITGLPSSGKLGDYILVKGTNLVSITNVRFNGVSTTFIQELDATQFFVQVPTGATTGKVTVTTPLGTATSPVDFVVQ